MTLAKTKTQTTLFFQKLRVRKDRGKRDAIYAVSGLIARSAKQSLRVRSGPSRPGAIPHAHTRGGLRVINFAVDRNQSIIGPVKFPRSKKFNEPVPSIHEFGKTVVDLRKGKVIVFHKRPYMSATLKRLERRGLIPKTFTARIARIL